MSFNTEIKITQELLERAELFLKKMRMKKTGFIYLAIEWLLRQEDITLPEEFLIKKKQPGYISRDARYRFYKEEDINEKVEELARKLNSNSSILYWYALDSYIKYLES